MPSSVNSWQPEFQSAPARTEDVNPYKEQALSPFGSPGTNSFGQMGKISYPSDPKHPLRDTVNNEFWNLTRSGLNYYFNPDSIGVDIYEEMYTSDETCRSAMQFLVLATLAKFGKYVHSNPEIETWVNSSLSNMQTPWVRCLKEILTAVWAGCSTTEIIVDYKGGQIVPRQLQTLHPRSVTFDLWLDGPLKNNLRAARQWRFGSYQGYLPAEKCIVFSCDQSFGNIYGQSRLRASWRSWFIKTKMIPNWAVVCDRYGAPHAIATVRDHTEIVEDPDTGEEVPVMEWAAKVLDRLSADGSVSVTEAIKIELMQAKTPVGSDIGNFVDYLDKMIYRGALIPSLVGDHGENGSYALGSKHYDLFIIMLEELAQSLSSVLVEQFVRRLITYNWGEQDNYGHFAIEDFLPEDEATLSGAFRDMVNTGIIKPGIADDLNGMRERLGWSPLTQEQIDSVSKAVPEKSAPETAPPPPETPEKPAKTEAKPANFARGVSRKPRKQATLLRRERY